MPPNARRRCAKIINQSLSRQQELAGGIKNALERGEPLAKVKQSFLNAGYKPEEIASSVQSMAGTIKTQAQPLPTQQQQMQQLQSNQQGATPQTQPNQAVTPTMPGQEPPKKGLSKTFIIVSIILTIIILGAAAFLGIYWNSIF